MAKYKRNQYKNTMVAKNMEAIENAQKEIEGENIETNLDTNHISWEEATVSKEDFSVSKENLLEGREDLSNGEKIKEIANDIENKFTVNDETELIEEEVKPENDEVKEETKINNAAKEPILVKKTNVQENEENNSKPIAKQGTRSKYTINDFTQNSAINVPVKSSKTPYIGVLKKQMPVKEEIEHACVPVKDDEFVEMAKKKDRVLFDEQHDVIYKENKPKPQSKSFFQMISDFFCCS